MINKVRSASNIVFITGAGISTDAGIPDFRSDSGHSIMGMTSQDLLSIRGWTKYPMLAYDFLESLNIKGAEPTIAHKFIKDIVDSGRCGAVITQNLDLLHEMSGISDDKIIHIHGTFGYKCNVCNKEIEVDKNDLTRSGNFKTHCCDSSTGRPIALLYGEQYDRILMKSAKDAIDNSDLIIAMGTGLDIIPIRELFFTNNRERLFINRDPIKDIDMKFVPHILGEFNQILKK